MRETHFIDRDPNIYEALTELQKRNVQSMNEEQVLRVIEDFEFRWYLHDTENYSVCLERQQFFLQVFRYLLNVYNQTILLHI